MAKNLTNPLLKPGDKVRWRHNYGKLAETADRIYTVDKILGEEELGAYIYTAFKVREIGTTWYWTPFDFELIEPAKPKIDFLSINAQIARS